MLGPITSLIVIPATIPIQPAQAFVDVMAGDFLFNLVQGGSVDFSNKGITLISNFWFADVANMLRVAANGAAIVMSGNALTSANVNGILAAVAGIYTGPAGLLDVSGGTNGPPTNQGLIDKATLVGNGWTILNNP